MNLNYDLPRDNQRHSIPVSSSSQLPANHVATEKHRHQLQQQQEESKRKRKSRGNRKEQHRRRRLRRREQKQNHINNDNNNSMDITNYGICDGNRRSKHNSTKT